MIRLRLGRLPTALLAVVVILATLPLPAPAAYNDIGPLSDILAIRKAHFGHGSNIDPQTIVQVIVDGDWGLIGIGSKGYAEIHLHRKNGVWIPVSDFDRLPDAVSTYIEKAKKATQKANDYR